MGNSQHSAMHSSYGRNSGMFHDRCKVSCIVNPGYLRTAVHDKSRLVPVHTSILEHEVTPEDIMMVALRIWYNLLAPTHVLDYVEYCCNGLLPRGHLRRLQSLAITLRT